MVILDLFLPLPFSIPFFLGRKTLYSFLAPSGPTEHSRSCSKPCSISNIYRYQYYLMGNGNDLPNRGSKFLYRLPKRSLRPIISSLPISLLPAPPHPFTVLSENRKFPRERGVQSGQRGLTGETTRFPTPSFIFSLIKSLTSLPSGNVCLNLIKGSRNCIRCESGGVESDSEGGGWA